MGRSSIVLLVLAACHGRPPQPVPPPADSGVAASTCKGCATDSDCGGDVCTQYAGGDFCAAACATDPDCGAGNSCAALVGSDGTAFNGCVPSSGTCGSAPG